MYQIVLTENKKKIKVLYTYSRGYDATYRFECIKNKKVHLPKKNIYKNKILTEVKYEVILLKEREDGDIGISLRDDYGRLLKNFKDDTKWVVLNALEYQIEEQFNVTGANRKLHALEILNNVLLPNISNKNPKQVVILNNRVIIEGIHLNMVTCKSVSEARRLYNKLRVHCFEKKIDTIIFFGSVPKKNKRFWYKKINALTGVSYNRLYRTSSR